MTDAVARASAGSKVAASPRLCGKIVAPTTLLWPCTPSAPYRMGIFSREREVAKRCRSFVMRAHAWGVFGTGAEPPPLSSEPT